MSDQYQLCPTGRTTNSDDLTTRICDEFRRRVAELPPFEVPEFLLPYIIAAEEDFKKNFKKAE